MHTTASKGRMLEKEESQVANVRCGVFVKLQGGCGKALAIPGFVALNPGWWGAWWESPVHGSDFS